MFAAVPSAKAAGPQANTVAEGAEPAALVAEVKKYAVQDFDPAASRGARLVESGLAAGQRYDPRGRRNRVNGRW
jgi:hypothetical protein